MWLGELVIDSLDADTVHLQCLLIVSEPIAMVSHWDVFLAAVIVVVAHAVATEADSAARERND